MMDLDDIMVRLNLLAEQLDHKPDDLHEVHMKVIEMLNELRATGVTPPDDLVAFERELARRVEGAE
jgi:hypothetical protein